MYIINIIYRIIGFSKDKTKAIVSNESFESEKEALEHYRKNYNQDLLNKTFFVGKFFNGKKQLKNERKRQSKRN